MNLLHGIEPKSLLPVIIMKVIPGKKRRQAILCKATSPGILCSKRLVKLCPDQQALTLTK